MSIQELGSIGEFVSALVVLISLLYVAIQLRTKNRIAQIAGHRDLIIQFNSWYREMEEPELVRIIVRGAKDFDDLGFEEKLRFDTYLHRFFHMTEQAVYMGRSRYIQAGSYDAFIRAAVAFTSYGAAKWWASAQLTFAPDFVELIETARKESESMPPIWELFPTFIFAEIADKESEQ